MFSIVIAAHSTWLGDYGELLNTCKRTISSLHLCVHTCVHASTGPLLQAGGAHMGGLEP